jgi:hypothetical protein
MVTHTLATEGQMILLKERTPSVGMIPEAGKPYWGASK